MKKGDFITLKNKKSNAIWRVLSVNSSGEVLAEVVKHQYLQAGTVRQIARPECYITTSEPAP